MTQMDDRTLLALAAKAVGLSYCARACDGEGFVLSDSYAYWNPLTNNGDALRLMLKLELMPDYKPYCKVRMWNLKTSTEEFWGQVGIEAATRRAIVRAAAAIGQEMK